MERLGIFPVFTDVDKVETPTAGQAQLFVLATTTDDVTTYALKVKLSTGTVVPVTTTNRIEEIISLPLLLSVVVKFLKTQTEMKTLSVIFIVALIALVIILFVINKKAPKLVVVRDQIHTDDYTITFGTVITKFSIGDAPKSIKDGTSSGYRALIETSGIAGIKITTFDKNNKTLSNQTF